MNEIPMVDIEDHVDRALDDALDMTFPASDPIAIFVPSVAAPFDGRKASSGGARSAVV